MPPKRKKKNHNKASKSHPSSTQCHGVNVLISKVKNKRLAGKKGLKQGWSPVGKTPNLTAPCPGLVTASSFHLCCGNRDLLLQLVPLSACNSPWWTSHILAPLIPWGLPRHWSLTFTASDRACVGALCQESKPDLRHIFPPLSAFRNQDTTFCLSACFQNKQHLVRHQVPLPAQDVTWALWITSAQVCVPSQVNLGRHFP